MEKFSKITSIPAYIPLMNIDTDKIIPKQFLKTIKRSGLGKNLFHELRYDLQGNIKNDFVLNWDPYKTSKILITGENFGCGSSREHAPWSLLDFGFKCIIATSFADIFYNNCFKNGILPIQIDENKVMYLMDKANKKTFITIDLEAQKIIVPQEKEINFEIDSFRRKCLLEGLDEIDLTIKNLDIIKGYENKIKKTHPWII